MPTYNNQEIRIQRWEMASKEMAVIFRQKSGSERLAIADGMWRSARMMILRKVRSDHPDWTKAECLHETARRMSHGAF